METVLSESPKFPLQHMVDNKQLMSAAPTVHWTLSFSIALGLVELLGSVVFDERGCVLEFDDDGE